jgi:hypothetical protein
MKEVDKSRKIEGQCTFVMLLEDLASGVDVGS